MTASRPPLHVRLSARLRRASLDRALADGTDPATSPELEWRARQLASPGTYRELAERLEEVVDEAGEPHPNAVVQIDREAVRCAREDLLTLAAQLAIADRANARGVALVRRLLTEGLSPLYVPSSPERLERFVRQARAALGT
ncbi:MAG TPA: hypothetical protein VF752_11065 [Thermoleophilaceae bacterium]